MDQHIKFDGVVGESAHKDHKGEIEVLSWTWGLSTEARPGGVAAGRAQAHEFTFTHLYDKASPAIAALAAAGRHVKQAWATARRAGDGQKDFLKITMKEVFITGVRQVADGETISEEVSALAGHITFDYRAMDAKGNLGAATTFDWDVVKNIVK